MRGRHCASSSGLNVLALFAAGFLLASAHADCAQLYDSLNDAGSIAQNGGVVSGPLNFVPGVNDQAVDYPGNIHITYSGNSADATGSVAFWFRKAVGTVAGGLLQFGELGQPNTVGVFQLGATSVGFEVRNAAGELGQIQVHDVLDDGVWTHIVAGWQAVEGGTYQVLSINGRVRATSYIAGAFSPTGMLQIGRTGWYEHAVGQMDELRYFDHRLSDPETYAEYVYSSNRHRVQPTVKPVSTGPVKVIGKTLYVNDQPFTVRGVGYAPTPIGAAPPVDIYSDPDVFARDVPFVQAMNVNVIRTWGQPSSALLLDVFYYNGSAPIYTLVGFWVPVSGIDYADPAVIATYENQFRALVNQFKDHPGLLGWGLGNELNIHNSGDDLAAWHALANRLAEVAYEEEGATYHPTVLVNADLFDSCNVDVVSDDVSLDHVDIWGFNTYFGWDAHCYFDYAERLTAKPVLITEYGIDAWDNENGAVYEDVQAEWVGHQWRQIEGRCAGASIMAYSDEWWKADNPWSHDFGGYGTGNHPDGYSNEEWWGMVWCQDNGSEPDQLFARQVFFRMAQEYGSPLADADADGDVDAHDVLAFQRCLGAALESPCGLTFDAEADDAIDGGDLWLFERCYAGPDRGPTCLD